MHRYQSNNKRIAKNTIMLYIRMLISMVVGLYTSRVVLQTLGVEDYGIYGVVGGVVSMLGFLNSSMAGATSRFITFELGRGDIQRVRDTFSSAIIIHVGIALIVILFAETIGLWFLYNQLVIPEERMDAAHWAYQCSIISTAVSITQTPYTAVVMSREKMDTYAYMEMLNVSLKLGIVYMLVVGNFDKLILYSVLTLAVSILMCMLYRIYCIHKFKESHFTFVWNKLILKPMINFSGWDLYGNTTVVFRQQGVKFLINMFFGVIYNATSGVASTLSGAITGLAYNIVIAFKPSIIKEYAAKNYGKSVNLILDGAKFTSLMMVTMTMFLFFEVDFVMKIWLGRVPEFSSTFCKLMLINGCVYCIGNIECIGIQATGNIIKSSIVAGTIELLSIPVLWLMYKFGMDVLSAYYCSIGTSILIMIVRGFYLCSLVPGFTMYLLFKKVIFPLCAISFILFEINTQLCTYMEDGLLRCVSLAITTILTSLLISFCFLLKKRQRIFTIHYLQKKFIKKEQVNIYM